MGGAVSSLQQRKLKNIYSLLPDVAVHKDKFSSLRLREEDIGKLFASFDRVVQCIEKNNGSGSAKKKKDKKCRGDMSVSIREVLSNLQVVNSNNNKFAMKLFSTFDENMTGKMNFKDFVFANWNICTVDTASLDKLCYDLYKEDGQNGQMMISDVKQLIYDIYGEHYARHPVARRAYFSLETIDPKADMSLLSVERFVEFCSRFDQLLQPVALLRDKLQSAVVQSSFWHSKLKDRNYLSGGRYVSVERIASKVQLAEHELRRKRNEEFLRLAYGAGSQQKSDDSSCATDSLSSGETLTVRTERKLKRKQSIFKHFSKLGKLENFFSYEGKVYTSPYKGMKKPPSRHVQKKIYVQAKERRLGISDDDPDSLAMMRAKKKADRKRKKISRMQELLAEKDELEDINEEKELAIESLEQQLESKDEEIARLKRMLQNRQGGR